MSSAGGESAPSAFAEPAEDSVRPEEPTSDRVDDAPKPALPTELTFGYGSEALADVLKSGGTGSKQGGGPSGEFGAVKDKADSDLTLRPALALHTIRRPPSDLDIRTPKRKSSLQFSTASSQTPPPVADSPSDTNLSTLAPSPSSFVSDNFAASADDSAPVSPFEDATESSPPLAASSPESVGSPSSAPNPMAVCLGDEIGQEDAVHAEEEARAREQELSDLERRRVARLALAGISFTAQVGEVDPDATVRPPLAPSASPSPSPRSTAGSSLAVDDVREEASSSDTHRAVASPATNGFSLHEEQHFLDGDAPVEVKEPRPMPSIVSPSTPARAEEAPESFDIDASPSRSVCISEEAQNADAQVQAEEDSFGAVLPSDGASVGFAGRQACHPYLHGRRPSIPYVSRSPSMDSPSIISSTTVGRPSIMAPSMVSQPSRDSISGSLRRILTPDERTRDDSSSLRPSHASQEMLTPQSPASSVSPTPAGTERIKSRSRPGLSILGSGSNASLASGSASSNNSSSAPPSATKSKRSSFLGLGFSLGKKSKEDKKNGGKDKSKGRKDKDKTGTLASIRSETTETLLIVPEQEVEDEKSTSPVDEVPTADIHADVVDVVPEPIPVPLDTGSFSKATAPPLDDVEEDDDEQGSLGPMNGPPALHPTIARASAELAASSFGGPLSPGRQPFGQSLLAEGRPDSTRSGSPSMSAISSRSRPSSYNGGAFSLASLASSSSLVSPSIASGDIPSISSLAGGRNRNSIISPSPASFASEFSPFSSPVTTAKLPSFPCKKSALVGFPVIQVETLPKLCIPPGFSLRQKQKQWMSRYIVLTTFARSTSGENPTYTVPPSAPPFPARTPTVISHLHCFKQLGASSDDVESERLEITHESVICVTDEVPGGRLHVLKVSGLLPPSPSIGQGASPDDQSDQSRRTDEWFFSMDGVPQLKLWMKLLKGIVLDLRAPAGPAPPLTAPRESYDDRGAAKRSSIMSKRASMAGSDRGWSERFDNPINPLQRLEAAEGPFASYSPPWRTQGVIPAARSAFPAHGTSFISFDGENQSVASVNPLDALTRGDGAPMTRERSSTSSSTASFGANDGAIAAPIWPNSSVRPVSPVRSFAAPTSLHNALASPTVLRPGPRGLVRTLSQTNGRRPSVASDTSSSRGPSLDGDGPRVMLRNLHLGGSPDATTASAGGVADGTDKKPLPSGPRSLGELVVETNDERGPTSASTVTEFAPMTQAASSPETTDVRLSRGLSLASPSGRSLPGRPTPPPRVPPPSAPLPQTPTQGSSFLSLDDALGRQAMGNPHPSCISSSTRSKRLSTASSATSTYSNSSFITAPRKALPPVLPAPTAALPAPPSASGSRSQTPSPAIEKSSSPDVVTSRARTPSRPLDVLDEFLSVSEADAPRSEGATPPPAIIKPAAIRFAA